MNRFILIISLSMSIHSANGQWDYGFLSEYFFGRKPNVKSQAMGGCYPGFESDPSIVYYNPAGLQLKRKEVVFQSSFSSPYYILDNSKFMFSGFAYGVDDKLSLALTFNHFNYGDIAFTDGDNNVIGYFKPMRHNFGASLNYKLPLGFSLGLNGNYFLVSEKIIPDSYTLMGDAGLEKKIVVSKTKSQIHAIFIAVSMFNFSKSSISYESLYSKSTSKGELPQTFNISSAYNFELINDKDSSGLKSHRVIFSSEFEDVLNSKYKTSVRFGLEYVFYKIIALRAGWFNTSEYDYGFAEINKSSREEFTHGFGLILPLELLTKNKYPLSLKLDLVNLKQKPLSSTFPYKMRNYTGLSFSARFQFK